MEGKTTVYDIRKKTICMLRVFLPKENWKETNKIIDSVLNYFHDNYVSLYKYKNLINYTNNLELQMIDLKKENSKLRESVAFTEKHLYK